MARPRAEDYLEKQQLILDQAAILFARKGFAGTSTAAIAEACSTSKALIYHYYQSKESILYGMLSGHCELLLDTAQKIMQKSDLEAQEKLHLLLRSFMSIYVSARAKHVVLLNDLHWLPEKQQKHIRELERKVVNIFKSLVRSLRPAADEKTVTALSMALMGSINWTYIWFKPDGPLTAQRFADITAGLFFAGIDGVEDMLKQERTRKSPLEAERNELVNLPVTTRKLAAPGKNATRIARGR